MQVAYWNSTGLKLDVAVNVAAEGFDSGYVADIVGDALVRAGLGGDQLILEVTERVVIGNHDRAMDIMGRLRSLGVRISLDDFGTGYSSLAYLYTLPIDELKIDRSFVSVDPSDIRRRVLTNIISLGKAFGQIITAEGVEDLETLDFLAAAGCHCAQGFAIAKPLAPQDLENWIRSR